MSISGQSLFQVRLLKFPLDGQIQRQSELTTISLRPGPGRSLAASLADYSKFKAIYDAAHPLSPDLKGVAKRTASQNRMAASGAAWQAHKAELQAVRTASDAEGDP